MKTLERARAGEPKAYRGHWIVPMAETVDRAAGPSRRRPQSRIRFDVLQPPPDAAADTPALETAQHRKTCASLISAQGWIDTFGSEESIQ